jgi:hypothetical protein
VLKEARINRPAIEAAAGEMNGGSRARMATDPVIGILTNIQSICHSSLLGIDENPVSKADVDLLSKIQQLRTFECSSFKSTIVVADVLSNMYLSLDHHTVGVSQVNGKEWRGQSCKLVEAILDVVEYGEATMKSLQMHTPRGNNMNVSCYLLARLLLITSPLSSNC